MKKSSFISLVILVTFLVNAFGPLPCVRAQEFCLPVPGEMVYLSLPENPVVFKGLMVHPEDPFKFDFILDKGNAVPSRSLRDESVKLVKYFLAALTTPENDLWVNLSPYEKDRIIPASFGQTDMGRDLLAEDYILKQMTASLIYPESQLGKKFWGHVYQEATKRYGTTNIPVNTFNKVWIVPDHAKVYEHGNTAFVVQAKLKVMLEEDYLALAQNRLPTRGHVPEGAVSLHAGDYRWSSPSTLGSQMIRELIIPELTREVNEGQNFATLRQVYYSLILAVWFKKNIKDSFLGRKYMDQNKISGIQRPLDDIDSIYQRYLKAFKKGVYNYIKEDSGPVAHEPIPRKYFSGGVVGKFDAASISYSQNLLPQEISTLPGDAAQVTVNLDRTQSEAFSKLPTDFAMQSKGAKSVSSFSEVLKFEFAGKKKLKVIDLGAGSPDFLIKMKTMLMKAGFESELTAVDRAWEWIKPDKKFVLNNIQTITADLEEPGVEKKWGKFDLVFLNAPSGLSFDDMARFAANLLNEDGIFICRFWKRDSLDLVRYLVPALKNKDLPFIQLNQNFKDLPDGGKEFSGLRPPIIVKKIGARFSEDIWPLAWRTQLTLNDAIEAAVSKALISGTGHWISSEQIKNILVGDQLWQGLELLVNSHRKTLDEWIKKNSGENTDGKNSALDISIENPDIDKPHFVVLYKGVPIVEIKLVVDGSYGMLDFIYLNPVLRGNQWEERFTLKAIDYLEQRGKTNMRIDVLDYDKDYWFGRIKLEKTKDNLYPIHEVRNKIIEYLNEARLSDSALKDNSMISTGFVRTDLPFVEWARNFSQRKSEPLDLNLLEHREDLVQRESAVLNRVYQTEVRLREQFALKTPLDDSDFKSYKKIGNGGEATIYAHPTNPKDFYKVFRDKNGIMELRNLIALKGVGGVPQVLEWGRMKDGGVWILMEGIEAAKSVMFYDESWRLLFSDIWSKYNLSQRLDKLARVAEILDQAHRLGLSHNDVKPENFLINENGDVMLIDWNLAMPFGVKQYGTKGFRSPEWIKQDQSDVYGLAVSLRVIFKIPSSNRDPVEESLENFRQQMGQNDPDARPLMKDVVKVLRSLAQMAANDRAKGNVPISELSPGGIDLTPKRLKLDVDSANAAVSQPIDLKKMENEEINGLYIKDIEIKPLHHLPELLGASASA